jgi:hypothetical protein
VPKGHWHKAPAESYAFGTASPNGHAIAFAIAWSAEGRRSREYLFRYDHKGEIGGTVFFFEIPICHFKSFLAINDRQQ